MQKIIEKGKTVLLAAEDMVLTNGQTYGRIVYLGAGDSADNWYEITEAEYEAKISEETNSEDEATAADYQSALRELGVNV